MNCETAIEILPWFLNGTLDPHEKEAVRRHLRECEACRLALAETQEAWKIFDQHLPSEAIVALAYDETPAGLSPQEVARHLASCARCAAELEMARTSRRLEGEENVVPFAPRRKEAAPAVASRSPRGWQVSALAAGLAGVIGLAGWINSGQQVRSLREQLAVRPAESPDTRGPLAPMVVATANPVLLDPLEAKMRDFGDSETTLPVGQASALQLNSDAGVEPAERAAIVSYRLEVAHVGGGKVAEAPVTLQPDGNYAVTVGNLPPGEYELRILGRSSAGEKPYESYRFKVAG